MAGLEQELQRLSELPLPTRANLLHCQIIDQATCPLCEQHVKTTLHLLRDFDFVKCIWSATGQQHINAVMNEDVEAWQRTMRARNNAFEWSKFFLTTYLIGRNQNTLVHVKCQYQIFYGSSSNR